MIETLIHLVIYIVVLGFVLWLLTYLVDLVPIQDPMKKGAKVFIAVIGVLIILVLALRLLGMVPPMQIQRL